MEEAQYKKNGMVAIDTIGRHYKAFVVSAISVFVAFLWRDIFMVAEEQVRILVPKSPYLADILVRTLVAVAITGLAAYITLQLSEPKDDPKEDPNDPKEGPKEGPKP